MQKAMREAKLYTSWVNPSPEHENATMDFVTDLLDPTKSAGAVHELGRFANSIADAGFLNGLAQTVLKICVPGVPDFYRGTELWDFNLVDPDNRRPVDYETRRKWLAELSAGFERDPGGLATRLLANWPDPRIKLFTIWRLLRLRRERHEIFMFGSYEPLEVRGGLAEHVLAFARVYGTDSVVAVVPRLTQRLKNNAEKASSSNAGWLHDWQDTAVILPSDMPTTLTDAFTGQSHRIRNNNEHGAHLPLRNLLRSYPVAAMHTGNPH
jgi:(1->4)-alpha-D-glucan 1-alpha-D-glucosylmutase